MKDPTESAKDLIEATGNVVKVPLNVITETIKGDPVEGVERAIENLGDAVDNVGDAIGNFFDW